MPDCVYCPPMVSLVHYTTGLIFGLLRQKQPEFCLTRNKKNLNLIELDQEWIRSGSPDLIQGYKYRLHNHVIDEILFMYLFISSNKYYYLYNIINNIISSL